MVDFSNVNSSVVLDVELSKDSDDTWFSVDNSDTSERVTSLKTKKFKILFRFFEIKLNQLKLLLLNLQK